METSIAKQKSRYDEAAQELGLALGSSFGISAKVMAERLNTPEGQDACQGLAESCRAILRVIGIDENEIVNVLGINADLPSAPRLPKS